MSPIRSDHRVLVVASDTVLAALVGALVETTGLQAAFPVDGERADDALARVKPLAAVLVDAGVDGVASDVFFMRARKRGVPVMIFGSRGGLEKAARLHSTEGVAAFSLPDQLEELCAALARVPDGARSDGGRAPDGERRVRTERSASGVLVLFDTRGRRWSVYDRRGGDRREPVHRRFVSDAGEAFGCDLTPDQAGVESAEALLDQLAKATPETAG